MATYYQLKADEASNGRPTSLVRSKSGSLLELNDNWYLEELITDAGEQVFDDDLICCTKFAPAPLTVSVQHDGTPRDFSFTLGDVPIVNARVANILNETARNDIQLIPAQIQGYTGQYAVLNVLRSEACVIEDRSMFSEEYWVDAAKAKNAAILRPKGLMLVVLVSRYLRNAFVQAKVTGVKFERVSE